MVLHGATNDVRHLVEATIVHFLHGMQDTPLYRLKSIFNCRHGPFQNYIRCIIEEPAFVHARNGYHIMNLIFSFVTVKVLFYHTLLQNFSPDNKIGYGQADRQQVAY